MSAPNSSSIVCSQRKNKAILSFDASKDELSSTEAKKFLKRRKRRRLISYAGGDVEEEELVGDTSVDADIIAKIGKKAEQ